MVEILDSSGKMISSSRSLAGIRRYVSKNLIKTLAIDEVGRGEGQLSILFDNGNSCQTNFASFGVLRDFVRRWRIAYGAPMLLNGQSCGVVASDNPAIQ